MSTYARVEWLPYCSAGMHAGSRQSGCCSSHAMLEHRRRQRCAPCQRSRAG